MLRNDGPIEDIDAFKTMHNRSFVFNNYVDALDLRIKDDHLQQVTDADLRNTTSMDELYQIAKLLREDNEKLKTALLGDREHLQWVQTASIDDLLNQIEGTGRRAQLHTFLNHFKNFRSPMVVIDHKQNIGCLRIKDGKINTVATPQWAKAYKVFKDDRLIQYGNRKFNGQVERDSMRRAYKAEHAKNKKESFQQRDAIKKRREQFAMLQNADSDEEEDEPKVGRFED